MFARDRSKPPRPAVWPSSRSHNTPRVIAPRVSSRARAHAYALASIVYRTVHLDFSYLLVSQPLEFSKTHSSRLSTCLDSSNSLPKKWWAFRLVRRGRGVERFLSLSLPLSLSLSLSLPSSLFRSLANEVKALKCNRPVLKSAQKNEIVILDIPSTITDFSYQIVDGVFFTLICLII